MTVGQSATGGTGCKRVTAFLVDGNAISVAAASRNGGTIRAEAFAHIELDRLVELTKRLRHPIFMDANLSFFPGKELIAEQLNEVLQRPEFRNPVVAVLAPDKMAIAEGDDPAEDAALQARRLALLATVLPKNPYHYPCAIMLQEKALPGARVRSRAIRVGLADYLPLMDFVSNAGCELLGGASALSASAHVARLLPSTKKAEPVTICDVGKLRTLYTTLLPGGDLIYNPIPVGLARDDMHYFKCISPVVSRLGQMHSHVGALLLSPDMTPSPLFSDYSTSAQVDCTRLAVQVSRYATRSFEANIRRRRVDGVWEGVHYLSGRGSRLPGLRGYMQAKLGTELRRVDRRPLARVEMGPGCRWADVGDNLLAFGAAVEALTPHAFATGLIPSCFQGLPQQSPGCSVRELSPNSLYVFERQTTLKA